MHSSDERPQLQFISRDAARQVSADGAEWLGGVTRDTTESTEFAFGTGTLAPGASAPMTPEDIVDRTEAETGIMLTNGMASVTIDGRTHEIHPFDAVFAPSGAEYTFENESKDPVEFVWGSSDGAKSGDIPDDQLFDAGGTTQIVHTLRDLDPVVTLNEGHSKRYWVPICPEVCGARWMGMGIIQRPPGSVAPLHEHDPPTLTEAFTVVEGRMQVTDQDGETFLVGPDDFLYVPEYGKHTNKNVGTAEMTYAFIECPARSRERITEMEQRWYDE